MTRDEALAAIRGSVSRGSSTPTLVQPREQYLQAQVIELASAVVEPVPVRVTGAMFPEHGLVEHLAAHASVAVARTAEKWLGYVPATGEFFLAYGSDATDLSALGFRSSDALAEWLG